MKDFFLLIFLMATLIGGALAVLYILDLMENISLVLPTAALGVYTVVAFSAIAVAINRA